MIPLLIAGAVALWFFNRAATPAVQLVPLPPGSAGISDPTQPLIAPAQPTLPPDLPQAQPTLRLRAQPLPITTHILRPIVETPFFQDTGDSEFTLRNPDPQPVIFSTLSNFSGGLGGGGFGGSGGGGGGTGGGRHSLK